MARFDDFKKVKCEPCNGTGKLLYTNTGIVNDCMYCNGFGKKLEFDPVDTGEQTL